tara:strand:+ start:5690 stop:6109 length:420 start_codon:yes stop_codon:yes gene_type:complete
MAKSSIANWRASGGALDISATHSGDGTVPECVAQDGKIICDFTALGSGETVTINTPFKFTVYDVVLVVGNGENVTSKTLTVKNSSTALSSAMSMATDKARVATATLDEDQAVFEVGDNDLTLVSSAHGDGGGTVYIYYR